MPAGIPEFFLPADGDVPGGYRPVVYGSARVHYVDVRHGIDVTSDIHAITPLLQGPVAVDWDKGTDTGIDPDALQTDPANPSASFGAVPVAALNPKAYAGWTADFGRWVARERPLRLFSVPALKLRSRPGESEGDFRVRVQQAAHEARDAAIERLRSRYESKVARAAERIRRAEEALARETQQAGSQKLQTAVSFGATLLGALMGRKAASLSTLGRATTAARGVGRTMKEKEDVGRARERHAAAEADLKALEADLEREVDALADPARSQVEIETLEIAPKRGSVDVRLVALAWTPTAS
jgi:hypothetical protein